MVKSVTDSVNCHSSAVIINAAKNDIYSPIDSSFLNSIFDMFIAILSGNVEIVRLNYDIRVNGLKCLFCCLNL